MFVPCFHPPASTLPLRSSGRVCGWVGLERHGRANLRVPPCGDVPEPCPPAGSRSSHAAPAQKLQMAEDSTMLAAKHGEGGNRSVGTANTKQGGPQAAPRAHTQVEQRGAGGGRGPGSSADVIT